jgi:hypothetical protein
MITLLWMLFWLRFLFRKLDLLFWSFLTLVSSRFISMLRNNRCILCFCWFDVLILIRFSCINMSVILWLWLLNWLYFDILLWFLFNFLLWFLFNLLLWLLPWLLLYGCLLLVFCTLFGLYLLFFLFRYILLPFCLLYSLCLLFQCW